MSEEKINSSESEGAFNEFIENQAENLVDHILNEGELDRLNTRGSDVIIEVDDITAPTFIYGGLGAHGIGSGREPGANAGTLRFTLPFDRLMSIIAKRLHLPSLNKRGEGRIKEVSYEFKTFAQSGVILDKKRTFKQALRTSIGTGIYAPQNNRFDIQFMRRDQRYKVPERVEKPKYKAVVFYMGDISYSTYGQRFELEKRMVHFIQYWLDFNYGEDNVEHRFLVHDSEAYEVSPNEFYRLNNAGGTEAFVVFDLAFQIAFNEYDINSTNFYAFYFGDGELFEDDAKKIVDIIDDSMRPLFNRIGVVELQPGQLSLLNKHLTTRFYKDQIVRITEIKHYADIVSVIQKLFKK